MQNRRSILLGSITYLALGLMVAPLLVLFGSSFTTTSFVTFPIEGFTFRWFTELVTDGEIIRGFIYSFGIAGVTSLICVGLGLAVVLRERNNPGPLSRFLAMFFLTPALVPSLVVGIGLLFFLSRIGWVGSFTGLIGGHVVLSLPFAIRSLASASRALDRSLERAATSLGATPILVIWKVTLPALRSGIVAAVMFSFLLSFNNITITLFIAGPSTRTLPLVLFQRSEDIVSPSIAAVATLMFVGTFVLLAVLQRRYAIFDSLKLAR